MHGLAAVWQTPTEIRKTAGAVTTARPHSLFRAFRDATWGTYTVDEGSTTTTIEARVLAQNPAYPNMQTCTVGAHLQFVGDCCASQQFDAFVYSCPAVDLPAGSATRQKGELDPSPSAGAGVTGRCQRCTSHSLG